MAQRKAAMTRAHFENIARAMAEVRPSIPTGMENTLGFASDQWERDCKAMARVCAASNPAFDRQKFLLACGLDPRMFA